VITAQRSVYKTTECVVRLHEPGWSYTIASLFGKLAKIKQDYERCHNADSDEGE
jgi:hypothetical protein